MTADPLQHSNTLNWPPDQIRNFPQFSLWSAWSKDGVDITVARAVERLTVQLRILDATSPLLTTDVFLRDNGTPHPDHTPEDPGAALYFTLHGPLIVLACDQWNTVAGNIAALASHLQALRTMGRWGVGTIEQAFAGYVVPTRR